MQVVALTSPGFPGFPLGSFNTASFTIGSLSPPGGFTKVEVIPQIRLDSGDLKACSERRDTLVATGSSGVLTGC